MPADGVKPVPEWGRILLGGIGCFLLAWISLAGGAALWLADALLIFLVLGRSGNALAGHLVAGAAGIVASYLLMTGLTGTFVAPASVLAVGSILHVALARFLLLRFAPARGAPRIRRRARASVAVERPAHADRRRPRHDRRGLDQPGPDASCRSSEIFVSMVDQRAPSAPPILLPFILSRMYSAPPDLKLLLSRRWEALLVLALVALLAAMLAPA